MNAAFSLLNVVYSSIQSSELKFTWSANLYEIFHPSCVSVNAMCGQKHLLLCILERSQSYVADYHAV